MTQPPAYDPAAAKDSLDYITGILTTSKALQNQPGLVWSLAQQKAHPADAGTIDEFLQGLDAEKQVRLASASPTAQRIVLDAHQKNLLDSLGVDYSHVEWTPKYATDQLNDEITSKSGGSLTVKRNPDGSAVTDAHGNPVVENTSDDLAGLAAAQQSANQLPVSFEPKAKKVHRGFLGELGHTLDKYVGSPIGTGLSYAGHGLAAGFNVISAGFSAAQRNSEKGIPGGSNTPAVADSETIKQNARAAGYGTDPLGMLAYAASGKAIGQDSDLRQQYGDQKIDDAIRFMQHPESFMKEIENDPDNYTTIDGDTTLNPDARDRLNYLNSDEFKQITGGIAARGASIGAATSSDIGLNPVDHPTAFALTSAGINLAAALMIDPTILAGKVYQVNRLAVLGSHGLDFEKIAKVLDPAAQLDHAALLAKTNPYSQEATHAAQVAAEPTHFNALQRVMLTGAQRRIQDFIDSSHALSRAEASGDTITAAGLQAKITAQHRELAPLIPDITGKNAIVGYGEKIVNGKRVAEPIYGNTEGIHSLYDFAGYIASKGSLVRLLNSTAMKERSLLPGAVSAFGARWLRGKTAAWLTERAGTRSAGRYRAVIDAAEHDPGLAAVGLDQGLLRKLSPEEDDAVSALNEQVYADKKALDEAQSTLESGFAPPPGEADDFYEQAVQQAQSNLTSSQKQLASARRAAENRLVLTDAGKGVIQKNVRRFGNPLGNKSKGLGWASPTAVAERSRLAATRMTTLLPRNTVIDINDAASADKIFKMARLYMNRGDSAALQVAWNVGDGGTRKAIIGGLLDQLAHASGLAESESGRQIMQTWRAQQETYSSAGDTLYRNGRPIAMSNGQVKTTWMLPDFRALQQAAQKIGLWDATMGRALTSAQADALMSSVKLGWLFKPSTVTRNQLEGWGRMAIEGQLGDALQARALMTFRNDELWRLGHGTKPLDIYIAEGAKIDELRRLSTLEGEGALDERQVADVRAQIKESERIMKVQEQTPIVRHHLAVKAGDEDLAEQIARGSLSHGQNLGRSKLSQRLADTAVLSLIGRAYHSLFHKAMDERDVDLALDLGPEDLAEMLDAFGQQATEAMMGSRYAASEATKITNAGYGTSSLRYAVHHGVQNAKGENPRTSTAWSQVEVRGHLGAEKYATALAQRVNKMPSVYTAILDHLEYPEAFGADHVVQAMDKMGTKVHDIGWGRDYWPDGGGEAIRATTADEVALGKTQYANAIIDDLRHMLTGQDGKLQSDLGDFIREHGKAPNATWINKNLKGASRPDTVTAPEVTTLAPEDGLKGLVATLQDTTGAGYQWAVERPLQRTTTGPAFLANYLKVRRELDPQVENLVENFGLTREAAENLAKELSIKNAWVQAEKLIDDPGQRAQFDVVARNIFPFSRATVAMIRRWGGGLYADPLRARKMMLAYEAAQHSGFIYTNSYGEPTFTYPASGAFNMALREIAKVPGFQNVSRFPMSASVTGGVLLAVPGADNPFRMSMGPMVTMPLREIKKFLPGNDQLIFDEIDRVINGPIGQGETLQQFVPTLAKRFYGAFNSDERDSALASSMKGALANLAAAGMIPPANASDSVRKEFIQNIRVQVRNQLFLRAVFGIFAPASPSQPSEGTVGSQADYAFQIQGIGQLSDEYKQILNDVGGDLARASAIWTSLHPDEVVYKDGIVDVKHLYSQYTVSQSQASAAKVSLPSTADSLAWMTNNAGFIKKYGNVAPYFLPEATTQQPFDDNAYRAQLELGLRQRKTPMEFYQDVMVRNAESIYYPVVDQYDAKIAQAKALGDDATATALRNQKSEYENQFKQLNPFFQRKIDGYTAGKVDANDQLGNLRKMVQDGTVPDGNGPLLAQLVKSFDGLETFIRSHPGTDADSTAMKQNARAAFNQWAQQHVMNSPLADLYSGVFRILDNNLANISGGPQ